MTDVTAWLKPSHPFILSMQAVDRQVTEITIHPPITSAEKAKGARFPNRKTAPQLLG
jgi:hypothetical protein